MINPVSFLSACQSLGIRFFSGVPDSLLKAFNACLIETIPKDRHIIAANEGAALSLGIGWHLGTEEIPLIYLQNSGIGNLINPLLSMASPEVYGIPMVLLIGWRGEPGVLDEPQHVTQGRLSETSLDALDIPTFLLPQDTDEAAADLLKKATCIAKERSCPVAILVKKNSFSSFKTSPTPDKESALLSRETVLKTILLALNPEVAIISTTGKTSRELVELRKSLGQSISDFLCVGGMGHASQIALGLSLSQPERSIVCLDGDGAALMHMGALPINAKNASSNFVHVLLNNGAHESVGGQPTVGLDIDFLQIAKGAGYQSVLELKCLEDISEWAGQVGSTKGPQFVHIPIALGSRADLGRPTLSPMETKDRFMSWLKK